MRASSGILYSSDISTCNKENSCPCKAGAIAIHYLIYSLIVSVCLIDLHRSTSLCYSIGQAYRFLNGLWDPDPAAVVPLHVCCTPSIRLSRELTNFGEVANSRISFSSLLLCI